MKNKGIAFRLSLSILSISSLLFALMFGYNYYISRKIIIKNVEVSAGNLAGSTVNRIDAVLRSVEKIPLNLAFLLENLSYDEKELTDLLRAIVQNNPEIYGAAIAFEPYAFSKDLLYYAPYFFKTKGGLKFACLGSDAYRYFYMDWYQISKELGRDVWSEPYYDEGGGETILATYSVPFYRTVSGKRRLMGIVTSDISLAWLQEIISSIKILKAGYGFLISKNGTIVTHPDKKLIMHETLFSVAEDRGKPELRKIGRDMISGASGFVPFRCIMSNRDCWMVYAPLSSSGWSLGAIFPRDELMSDIYHLNRIVFILGLIGFFCLFLVIIWIAGSITRPLRTLAGATEDMSTGNLDITLPAITSKDEVGKLTNSFDYMRTSLKRHIKELTEATASKERIESELKIAHDIQMGILPNASSPFPLHPELDIHATLVPAKEVGGDLYNFFFMDDDHLCFTVGDVSGKGVPASLFMAITQTLIKAKAHSETSPDRILQGVNDSISQDNPSLMFVTLFLGILNIRTGELNYSNGGHNPPYILRLNGAIDPLETMNGMALGVIEGFSYQSRRIMLKKGEAVFLYTDGVTEAMNEREELFSEDGLKEEISLAFNSSPQEAIAGIMEKIRDFSKGMPQTDDITMMILRYYGE